MLKNKCAFVTGGASGIAFATAKKFLENGAKVTITDIAPQEKLDAVLAELSKYGEVYGIRGDVTKSASVKECIEFAVEKMGQLDIGFNCATASFPNGDLFHEYNEENFYKSIEVNLYGEFHSVKHEAAQMIKQGTGGSIINMASINATIPAYGMGGYCCSKAAIVSMTNCAAIELGKYNVRVNSISPGFTATELVDKVFLSNGNPKVKETIMDNLPLLRMNDPADVANTALFLASDLSRQYTGANLVIDGGMQHMSYPQVKRYMMPEGKFEALYK